MRVIKLPVGRIALGGSWSRTSAWLGWRLEKLVVSRGLPLGRLSVGFEGLDGRIARRLKRRKLGHQLRWRSGRRLPLTGIRVVTLVGVWGERLYLVLVIRSIRRRLIPLSLGQMAFGITLRISLGLSLRWLSLMMRLRLRLMVVMQLRLRWRLLLGVS